MLWGVETITLPLHFGQCSLGYQPPGGVWEWWGVAGGAQDVLGWWRGEGMGMVTDKKKVWGKCIYFTDWSFFSFFATIATIGRFTFVFFCEMSWPFVKWNAMEFSTDIYGAQKTHCNNFGGLQTFYLAALPGKHLGLSNSTAGCNKVTTNYHWKHAHLY